METEDKEEGMLEQWKNGMMEWWKQDLFVLEGILPITEGLLSLERFNQFKQPILDFVVELV